MYSIQKFVLEIMKEKRISKSEFVQRIGYSNIAKGCKRFDSFIENNTYNKTLIDNLHLCLDISKTEVDEKIQETKLEIQREIEEQKALERKAFVPFLFVHTSYRIPSPIFVCAILGADRRKVQKLPLNYNLLAADDQHSIRQNIITDLLKRYDGLIPTFGSIICFTLKRLYDDIEEEREVYDLNGDLILDPPVEFRKIYSGSTTLTIKRHDITSLFYKLRQD